MEIFYSNKFNEKMKFEQFKACMLQNKRIINMFLGNVP